MNDVTQQTPVETFIPAFPIWLDGREVLGARAIDVHEALQSKQQLLTWICRRIRSYGFREGIDYLKFQTVFQVKHRSGMRSMTRDEYEISLDMAKELAMVERTEVGQRVRRYFIDCEKKFLNQCMQDSKQLARIRAREEELLEVDLSELTIDLRHADQSAINRQAWVDVSQESTRRFHARREALFRKQQEMLRYRLFDRFDASESSYPSIPAHMAPTWVR